ncbi:uncharacterized protein LOC143853801 [Tasmannia lanceolata]|uniref:uncharacterized protein LOC143853801 n=1 Tax=Tasmannia lanceolata TaxID=3420 RepID=UPI0040630A83
MSVVVGVWMFWVWMCWWLWVDVCALVVDDGLDVFVVLDGLFRKVTIMPRQLADRRMLILRAAAIVIPAAAAVTLRVRLYLEQNITRAPYESGYLTGRTFVRRITNAEDHCIALLRMDVRCFRTFVALLRNTTLLEDTIHCTVEEQVMIFLSVISHNERNRTVRATTRRSGTTVSKYFNKVLDAVLILHYMFIARPSRETPRAILDNPNSMPYFKDCLGAIDGTHIPAKVSQDIQKDIFVIRKFYVGDAGYPCLSHLITPIRGIGYHLNQIRGRRPRKLEELYNQRHSSARNVIERTFGVLKKRFGILNSAPMYSYDKQIDIVLACCCVHNHIRREMPDDAYIQDVDDELALLPPEEEEEEGHVPPPPMIGAEDLREGHNIRTTIMNQMWNDFQPRRRR